MSLRLIIEDDEGSTTVVPLASDAITIGRQQGNTIQLTEKNVSRRHARLYPESDGWIIEDLGSYNGIKVNNDAVDGRTKLREGDVVEIGDYHLAITEDVDKSPLNFRSGQAANDGAVEPMLVSSSADLPRLSAEEIAALQSGQQPIAPPPRNMMVDSGPVPASQYRPGYGEPERRSRAGLFIVLGLVVVAILALGIFWVLSADKGGTGEVVAGTPDRPDGTQVRGQPDDTPPPPTADGGGLVPDAADDGIAETDTADDGVALPEQAEGGEETADTGEMADTGEDSDDTADESGSKSRRPRQPRQPRQPKAPKAPPVDVDALIADARQKQYKDPTTAYRLAKQAYTAKPSTTALWVMGPAACRLKDRSKANWVLKRLKGAEKTKLKDICASKGLEL